MPSPTGRPDREDGSVPGRSAGKARRKSVPNPAQRAAHLAIRGYQLTLSGLIGRTCRHLPTCSAYTDEAIQRHGFWAGGWMGLSRICRCGPFGTSGLDLVPEALPADSAWYKPWAFGRWRGTHAPPVVCEAVEPDGDRPSP